MFLTTIKMYFARLFPFLYGIAIHVHICSICLSQSGDVIIVSGKLLDWICNVYRKRNEVNFVV